MGRLSGIDFGKTRPFKSDMHLWHLRRAMGGHLAHAVPLGAPWASGKAACGFIPSSPRTKCMTERHGWESCDASITPCRSCRALAPSLFPEVPHA